MTFDSVKAQRNSMKNARSTVLSQKRRRKLSNYKSGLINVLITFVPRVLFQRVGENSGKKEACITSVVACLRSTEQITPVVQARSKVWSRFTLLNFLDEHHHLFHIVLLSLIVTILQSFGSKYCPSYLGAKSRHHPGYQKKIMVQFCRVLDQTLKFSWASTLSATNCSNLICCKKGLNVGGKALNIYTAFQQCCKTSFTLGPFIRGKIRRVLHKTRLI